MRSQHLVQPKDLVNARYFQHALIVSQAQIAGSVLHSEDAIQVILQDQQNMNIAKPVNGNLIHVQMQAKYLDG